MTTLNFSIVLYVGAKPVLLGMSRNEVEAVLGQPRIKSRNFRKELSYDYHSMNVGFDGQEQLCHIGFVPGSILEYDGASVWTNKTFNRLCLVDGNPKEVVGFIVLLSLGIAFTGFHDGEDSQKAVSLFARGGYDELKPKMKDFVMNTA